MRLAVWVCLLAACDGGGTDAGMDDAGVDAAREIDGGSDAGMSDGGVDAGSDAGPPTPMETALDVDRELTATNDAVADVPMDMRVGGAYVETASVITGIDRVIGEKGLGTLSLDAGAVRAWADVRQCNVLIDAIDRATERLAERPEPELSLFNQLLVLRGTLVAHRDAVARLYLARRDAVIGPFVESPMFREEQSAFGTETAARLTFAAEGQTSTGEAVLDVSCPFGSPVLDVHVFDDVTGAELGMHTTGGGSAMITLAIPIDETSIIDVTIDGFGARAMEYLECFVSLQSRRRFRVTPVFIGTNPTFFDALSSFRTAQFQVANETTVLRGGTFDETVCDAIDAHAGVMTHLVAVLLGSGTTEVPVESLERMRREAEYVRAMTVGVLGSGPIATAPELVNSRAALTDMETAIDAMLGSL